MRKKWMALAAASLIAVSCTLPARAEEPARRSLTVTGSAEITAVSDRAALNVTVETSSPNAKAAARENANTMSAVRNAVIAAGADAGKLQTRNYNIYPQQEYDTKGRLTGTTYHCSNSLHVIVTDLDKTSAVMDAAIGAGANRIDSVDFSVGDTAPYRDRALSEAAKDALRKANTIASALGRQIVNVISVSEDSVSYVPRRLGVMKLAASNAMAEDAATPIEGGESKLQGRVTVVFEID